MKDERFIRENNASIIHINDDNEAFFGKETFIDEGLLLSPFEDTGF